MDDDKVLPEVSIPIDPATKQAKLKTRITGHGHESNTELIHIAANGRRIRTKGLTNGRTYGPKWKIWQEERLRANPVYPQGGTWPGSREGAGVRATSSAMMSSISLTHLKSDEISFDYQLTPVPSNNLGMGNGNYIMAMQLVEYGDANHQVDAEIYDAYAPNNFPLYSPQNPLCVGPKVVIRNNGSSDLTSLKFNYGESGGTRELHSRPVAPNEKDTISLPISSSLFWMGDLQRKFNLAISEPNGVQGPIHCK